MQEFSSSDCRPVGFFAVGASQQNAYIVLPHLAVQLPREADPLFLTPSLLGLQCQLEQGVYRGDTVLAAGLLSDAAPSVRLATPTGLVNMSHELLQWDSGDQNMTSKLRAAFGHYWKEQAVELDRVMRYSLSVPGAARNNSVLECSREDILQASNFGLLSFQRNGPRQPSLVLEMLQEKLQRHTRYIEMLALEGKLPQGQRSLIDELGAPGRAELLQHHAMIYSAVELLQLQAGEAGQSRVMSELVSKAVDIMRERVRSETGGSEKDKLRRDEANSPNFDGTFWLYSYTHSIDELLYALEAAKQQMPQSDVYEVSAAVAMLFEVLLGTVVSVYEQRQKEGFMVGSELDFPRLPYEVRHVLLQTILETGKRVQDRMKGSWAPQLQRSLLHLVRIYLQAHRAHGLMAECYLADGPYEDNDYAKPRETCGGGKAVLFSRSKVLYSLMLCDPVNAQQLAEEFEDCTTLAYVALRNEDPTAGRALLVEYVSRFEKVFIAELLALLFAHGRIGDMLQFVLTDVRQEYRGVAVESLQEFIDDELKCNKAQAAQMSLQQLQWLLQLQSAGASPDSSSCEVAAMALHSLCTQGGSYDQRTHAALACLTAAATDIPREEGNRSEAVSTALTRCRLREIEVTLHPDQFAVRSCGVGQYPHPVDAPARSWEDLTLACLVEVGFDHLKNKFHSELQGRFPEQIAIERLQDFSISRRVWALEVCELHMTAHQILSHLKVLCPSVWHRAKAAVAALSLDHVEQELQARGMVDDAATDEDRRAALEAVFRAEDQHHDTPLVDAMRSVLEGDHQHAENVVEIMQCRAALKHRMLIWNGNPQKYGRKAQLEDFPQVPGALDDPASLPELDWESSNSGIVEGYINSTFYRTASEWLENVKTRSGQHDREAELKLMAVQFQHARMPQLVNDLTGGGFFQRCRRPHPVDTFLEDVAEDDV
eukprot:TRINITY_DN2479_c0_g1_i3.p1 TRINITY_DN2479_c0_g1~~TRINITY_DN2479_c0_g1_i3.p1  ORF type:complete len:939 (-),score=242.29 TRINITY_DN2479_c0_g1_i3:98-2914(-)